jgi:hypothetical protein
VFRKKGWLTIAQLMQAWGRELTKDREDPKQVERDLQHLLIEDIINDRLDESGPLVNDQRLGLRIINSRYEAEFITRRELVSPLGAVSANPRILDRIVVMKEAVLDFAGRWELPPPSWWAESEGTALLPGSGAVAGQAIEVPDVSPNPAPTGLAKPPGRKPKKLEQVKVAMRSRIKLGRLSVADLLNMPEKTLAADYNVSRDTARKARKAVLSEMSQLSETQVPTITTNDK